MVHQGRSHLVTFVIALLLAVPVFAQQQPGFPCCPEYDNGNSGTAITVNFQSRSNVQKVVRNGNCTYTLTAPNYASFVSLRMVHDATATVFTVTFSPTVKWPNGAAPTFTNTANAIDIVNLYWDGANWYGVVNTAFA